ncbi:UDP-N-acetylmuramoyl-tripeptide--D-alanyl-D-alanine ligase [bacterium]|nr:UDP-N-acetylmuramoyl-tripeptide--D-alanyl-D-alanine ligase [bacterium]
MMSKQSYLHDHEQAIMNDKRLRVTVDFSDDFKSSEPVKRIFARALPGSMRGVCIDSRVIESGDVFFAIKGESGVDGHDFAQDALNKGACAIVVSKKDESIDPELQLEVDDTLVALQKFATAWRKAWGQTVVAITGSNGKTSTKYLCFQILKAKFKITPPRNSWNNALGVPLSLLSIQKNDDLHVLELGMNHPGEIYPLTAIAQPDIAGITNIGRAHIGFFENIEGIAQEKKQILRWLNENKSQTGTAIINLDDSRLAPVVESKNYGFKKKSFSLEHREADVYVLDENQEQMINYGNKGQFKNTIRLLGKHNLSNVLFALCVADVLNIDADSVKDSLPSLYLPALRQETIVLANDIVLLLDCYNANLDSTLIAIKTLSSMSQKNKVLVLGDMAENGVFSRENHLLVAKAIAKESAINTILCFGDETKIIAEFFNENESKRCFHFNEKEPLLNKIKQEIQKDMVILFKGSRSNALETVVAELQKSPKFRKVG